jgi:uncharacterized membrane protein YtjA (UPF0391 family)
LSVAEVLTQHGISGFLSSGSVPLTKSQLVFLEGLMMLRLAVVFLIIGLIAAFFGFGMVEGFSFEAAKILFFVFIVLAVLSLLGGVMRRPPV